jgi:hypothetical protein
MSGIDGGRGASATAITRNVASAVHPGRLKTDHRPAFYAPSGAGAERVARAASARAPISATSAIGFLAQAIAQESLLLGARASKSDQKDPIALYRQTQDDAPAVPGQQIGIDIKI